MDGATAVDVLGRLQPVRSGFDSPVARSSHDPQTCPVCAPIIASPAYRRGVERAERASEAR